MPRRFGSFWAGPGAGAGRAFLYPGMAQSPRPGSPCFGSSERVVAEDCWEMDITRT